MQNHFETHVFQKLIFTRCFPFGLIRLFSRYHHPNLITLDAILMASNFFGDHPCQKLFFTLGNCDNCFQKYHSKV